MNQQNASLDLNEAIRLANELADAIGQTSGENLRMVAVYGSAARGDFDPAHSDLNLLIVLEDAGANACLSLGELLQPARARFRCAPFVIAREELVRGADVFPIKFHEIRRCYRVLRGEDLLKDLVIDFSDLRHACEHELRNMTLKLRRTWIMEHPRPAPLVRALNLFVPQLLGVLRVVVEHDHVDPACSSDAFLAEVSRRYGVQPQALSDVIALRHRPDADWPAVDRAWHVVLDLAGQACRAVDQWRQA